MNAESLSRKLSFLIVLRRCSLIDGKVRRILKNSWSKHLSLTYNEKYEYGEDTIYFIFSHALSNFVVMRVTWTGYEFFGTLSLAVYLIQACNAT